MALKRLCVAAALIVVVACGTRSAAVPSPTPSPVPTPTPPPVPTPATPQRMEASLPAPVEETGAAVAAGKLYVMGGFDAAGRSLSTVYVFDGTAWHAGPGLSLAVDHPSPATLAGSVLLSVRRHFATS